MGLFCDGDTAKRSEGVVREDLSATATALGEGKAREREGVVAALQAEEERARAERLLDGGAISPLEWLRLRADAERRQAAAEALGFGTRRLVGEQRTRASQVLSKTEELRREIVSLDGKRITTEAAIASLEADIARRVVRAPTTGVIGEIARLTPGAYVKEGERIATIVPAGELRVVAQLPPAEAVGRVASGQKALARLDAYPWAEFGTVRADVTRVATEPRDGFVRVDLTLDAASNPHIRLEHGMTGTVEIDIERISPARLTLRAAGAIVDGAPPRAPRAGGSP